MSLKIAIQMDPVGTINVTTDSSFMLALEGKFRGHVLYHYLPSELCLEDGRLYAQASKIVEVKQDQDHPFRLTKPLQIDLGEMDIILMRQDPPFDMSYLTATYLLEHVVPEVLVLNDPVNVRNSPEKLLVTHFSGVAPPTLISANKEQISNFREKYKDVIIKPLYGNGGAEVFHLKPEDENLGSLLDMFFAKYREPIITQKYLPEIRNGDKRIILVDGEPVGGVLRVPAEGDSRANFHAGGGAQKTTLTDREREICSMIGPTLSKLGLLFVGIDVIGDYLTEINVTSPTGIQEINRLDSIHVEKLLWDAIEAQLDARQSAY